MCARPCPQQALGYLHRLSSCRTARGPDPSLLLCLLLLLSHFASQYQSVPSFLPDICSLVAETRQRLVGFALGLRCSRSLAVERNPDHLTFWLSQTSSHRAHGRWCPTTFTANSPAKAATRRASVRRSNALPHYLFFILAGFQLNRQAFALRRSSAFGYCGHSPLSCIFLLELAVRVTGEFELELTGVSKKPAVHP